MRLRNVILIAAAVLLVILIFGCKSDPTGSAVANKPECNDRIDNDGDGKTDYPADTGCSSRKDNDESNCGDGVCEGGELCDSCIADCGHCNSCSDTDGGKNYFTQGTISGYGNNNYYNNTDYCINTILLNEYFCDGVSPSSESKYCSNFTRGNSTNQTMVCQNGKCV